MEYINNIATGFSVQINNETGDFSGIPRSGKYHKSENRISGNINTMTDNEKLNIERILQSAFPEMKQKFCEAYVTLLPGYTDGWVTIVEN